MTGTPAPDGGATQAVLDLTGVRDRQAFMDACAAHLRLPDWFGRNWDALADCLTDLSWWPPGPDGRRLVIRGWRGYAAARPREWRIVKEVARDAETFWWGTDSELTVILEEPALEDGTSGAG
jgi:hypothetical protein